MNNQIEVSKSYFINKSIIKTKNKRRHEKIRKYEEMKSELIREPGQKDDHLAFIELLDIEIIKLKSKINIDTLKYCY